MIAEPAPSQLRGAPRSVDVRMIWALEEGARGQGVGGQGPTSETQRPKNQVRTPKNNRLALRFTHPLYTFLFTLPEGSLGQRLGLLNESSDGIQPLAPETRVVEIDAELAYQFVRPV